MTQLTQEQIKEVKKCKDNPVYFINHYIKHYHFKDGLREFKLYEPQEKLIHKYHKNRFNIVKAPRQIAGKSLTAIYYILHLRLLMHLKVRLYQIRLLIDQNL